MDLKNIGLSLASVPAFIWKWFFCSWIHRRYHCYPVVWGPEEAKKMGIPYKPNYWHCDKCHPCGEEFAFLIKNTKVDVGPQRATPSSVGKINAENKQTIKTIREIKIRNKLE